VGVPVGAVYPCCWVSTVGNYAHDTAGHALVKVLPAVTAYLEREKYEKDDALAFRKQGGEEI